MDPPIVLPNPPPSTDYTIVDTKEFTPFNNKHTFCKGVLGDSIISLASTETAGGLIRRNAHGISSQILFLSTQHMPEITGIWSVEIELEMESLSLVILSFIQETRALFINGSVLYDYTLQSGIRDDVASIKMIPLGDCIVQVCETGVTVSLCCNDPSGVKHWISGDLGLVIDAATLENFLYISLSTGKLVVLKVVSSQEDQAVSIVVCIIVDLCIRPSCIFIPPPFADDDYENILIIGTDDALLYIYDLLSLREGNLKHLECINLGSLKDESTPSIMGVPHDIQVARTSLSKTLVLISDRAGDLVVFELLGQQHHHTLKLEFQCCFSKLSELPFSFVSHHSSGGFVASNGDFLFMIGFGPFGVKVSPILAGKSFQKVAPYKNSFLGISKGRIGILSINDKNLRNQETIAEQKFSPSKIAFDYVTKNYIVLVRYGEKRKAGAVHLIDALTYVFNFVKAHFDCIETSLNHPFRLHKMKQLNAWRFGM